MYGVYKKVDEIPWDKLPKQFVIKCNHASGYNIICADKSKLDIEECKKKLTAWMKDRYGMVSGEYIYTKIKRRIVIEEYLGEDIDAIKFFCFNGVPKMEYLGKDDQKNGIKDKYFDMFDENWNRLDWNYGNPEHHKHQPGEIPKPQKFEEMKEMAKMLSRDFPFVRVDLYSVNDKIYFSELTFFPTAGIMVLEKAHLEKMGSWLKL